MDGKIINIPKSDQVLNSVLLSGLMNEIKLLTELKKADLTKGLTTKRIMRRFSLIMTDKVQ